MEGKLKSFDVETVGDLRKMELATLEGRFGRYGVRLYELSRGIDKSEVIPDRPTQSISSEDTFERDLLLTEMEPMIRRLAEHTWEASRKESRIARTVVLKLKTSDFKILTRYALLSSRFLQGIDNDRAIAPGPCWPEPWSTFSPRGRWSEQLSRRRGFVCSAGSFYLAMAVASHVLPGTSWRVPSYKLRWSPKLS